MLLDSVSMIVAVPVHERRISPLLDVARFFWAVELEEGSESSRHEVRIDSVDLVVRAKRIVEMGAHVLICGALSLPLERLLVSAGMVVIPNTCGLVEDVLFAFMSGRLTDRAFLMPGCKGRRRRRCRRLRGGKW